jgi:hypothetical protein
MENTASILLLLVLALTPISIMQAQFDVHSEKSFYEIQKEGNKLLEDMDNPHRLRDYKLFRRWEISNEACLGPNGQMFNYSAQNYKELVKYKKEFGIDKPGSSRITHGDWTPRTPNEFDPPIPQNGRINTVAVHPANENIIYAGATVGGLWKSIDAGENWFCLTDGLPVIGISGIAIHPTQPNTIYILTGDGDGRDIPSIGVLVSLDGGYTWQKTGLEWNEGNLIYGYKLLLNPLNPNLIYAATNGGLFVTQNGGASWNQKIAESMRDIEFVPGSPDTVYASSWRDIYRSVDNGVNFTNLTTIPGSILPDTDNMTRVALAVTPAKPSWVYALYAYNVPGGGDGFKGLYVSTNRGNTWSLYSSPVNSPNIVGADTYNQTHFDLVMAIDPLNHFHILAGGIFLFDSPNLGSGGNWNLISPTLYHGDIHDIQFTQNHIYIATDGGMSRSDNGGVSWADINNGLDIAMVYDFDIWNNQKFMMGRQDNGTHKWNFGDSEAIHILSGDGFECMFHYTNPDIIYACTQEDRYRSINGGSTWTEITPPGDSSIWEAAWIMHPTNPDTLYNANRKIWRTYNRGSNWVDLNAGFTDDRRITEMAQGTDNPNRLYASDGKTIKRTINLHAATPTWFNISPGLPIDTIVLGGIAVDPEDANKLWCSFAGYGNGLKVFQSINSGSAWTNISGSLPNVPVRSIVCEPGTNDGLYIGTDVGVFYRNNTFTDWIYFSNGLPNTRIEDLKVIPGYLYAGTFGRSIWRTNLYTPCSATEVLTVANDPSNPNSTGTQVYEASTSITSTRNIVGGLGTDVTYKAGSFVLMNPGFEVKSWSLFTANIGGCSQ